MRKFLYLHLEKLILSGLLLLALISYGGGYYLSAFKDLLVNLSAGFLSAFLTISGIEYSRQWREERRSSNIRESIEQDMRKLAKMFVSYMASPLGFSVLNYERRPEDDGDLFARRRIGLVLNEASQSDLSQAMRDMTIEEWKALSFNLSWIRQAMHENIQTYSAVMPPEVYGSLLKVRIAFYSIFLNFGLFIELFTKPEAEWPVNRQGVERNQRNREHIINTLSRDMRRYFSEVQNLFEQLNTVYED